MDMSDDAYDGLGFAEGFFLFAGLLWIVGAILLGGVAYMGASKVGLPGAASNQTPVANSPQTS
jgi:hypothetical protein